MNPAATRAAAPEARFATLPSFGSARCAAGCHADCGRQAGQAGRVAAHAVEHAEVEGAAEAGADHGGGGAAPELAHWTGAIEDLAEDLGYCGRAGAGLLDAGFE